MTREVTLTITIALDHPDATITDLRIVGAGEDSGLSNDERAPEWHGTNYGEEISGVLRQSRFAVFEIEYAERARAQMDVELSLPDSERRRDEYVNFFPPPQYGKRRASGLGIKSGRLEIYCDPSHAEEFEHARVVNHNGEPTWVQVYLTSHEAVADALALTSIGLEERS